MVILYSEILTLKLVVDFLPIIVYVHDMIFCTNKRKLGLSGIAVLVFYLISIVLTPLFHQHPGEYHPGSINTGYHSHAEPFATDTPEHSEDNNREDVAPHHFSKTNTAFEDMVGVAQVNPGNIINPLKFPPISGVLILPMSSENRTNQFSRKNTLFFPSPYPHQDYQS